MFSTVVVALDLSTAADRALPVANALARLGGLPIELLTVASGGGDAAAASGARRARWASGRTGP